MPLAHPATPVRVMLVDDHAVVRAGYRRLLELEPEFAVVAEHGDADAAYQALAATGCRGTDVLVLDLSMPGRGGLDLLRRITLRWGPSAPRVLVFSMHDSPALVAQATQAGAAGFVTKASPPEELVQVLRRVARGEPPPVLSADIAVHPGAPGTQRQRALHEDLSTREFQVLQGLIAGHTLEAIGERLHLSPKTISNYQAVIRQKLKVNTAVELLRYAREAGLG